MVKLGLVLRYIIKFYTAETNILLIAYTVLDVSQTYQP